MNYIEKICLDYLLGISNEKGFSLWTADEEGVWACHSCGLLKALHGNPYDNDFYYCPKCGKKIVARCKK